MRVASSQALSQRSGGKMLSGGFVVLAEFSKSDFVLLTVTPMSASFACTFSTLSYSTAARSSAHRRQPAVRRNPATTTAPAGRR